MNAQRATAALHQSIEVTGGLRRLHHAKAVGMTRHVEIARIVAGDLQEDAGIRAALVSLSCRVLETRSKAKAGCRAGFVADTAPHPGQGLSMCLVALDVGEQRHVVARFCPAVHAGKMTLQMAA